ncbi:MAG TPA: HNH endonuclease, partial [Segetibacter sp.]
MKWQRIPKEKAKQPKKGNYKLWKDQIAKEGFYQCVYCALPEPQFGGIRNFHVEHYKPKKKFQELENDIKNLFYACPICNIFKGDSWPGEPLEDHATSCFPNPSTVDYNVLFKLDYDLGIVEGNFPASLYLISALHLNRPQLVLERRTYHTDLLTQEVLVIGQKLLNRLKKAKSARASELAIRMGQLFIEIVNLEIELRRIRPYTSK